MPITAPATADAQFARASALWQQGQVAGSESILRELVTHHPAREDAALLLAKVLRSQGRLSAASRVVFELCRARGFELEPSLRGAQFIQECQRQSLASELCEATIASGRDTPALQVVAGNIARELGDFAKARTHYLAALDANVDLNKWFVLGALANTMRYPDTAHPDFARFAGHFRNKTFTIRSRASTGFGLAKAFDDTGDHEQAASVLREANALVRTTVPWDASAWFEFVKLRKFERVARVRSMDTAGFIPVFVVGLPRSGTTLVATRLTRFTSARDRGELRMLRFIAEQLIGGAHLDDANAMEEAARLYRMHARQDDAPAIWYIDQDPLNFRYLHIIEALFPQARIIHCRRDKRDTALSLWSQDFAHPDCAFAYDFVGISNYVAGYDDLMQHWYRRLTLPIHAVDYEAVVAEPEQTLARLCDFIGAPAADAATRSPVTPINTASVWQARQPVYSTSVGRWRAYSPFVPELAQFDAGN